MTTETSSLLGKRVTVEMLYSSYEGALGAWHTHVTGWVRGIATTSPTTFALLLQVEIDHRAIGDADKVTPKTLVVITVGKHRVLEESRS